MEKEIMIDYAIVALRMLNDTYNEEMEEKYNKILNTILRFIPKDKINNARTSKEVPNLFLDYM